MEYMLLVPPCIATPDMSPLIFLALSLGMEIVLCWPVSVGDTSAEDQSTARHLHRVPTQKALGCLCSPRWRTEQGKISRMPWISCSLLTEHSDSPAAVLSLMQAQVLAVPSPPQLLGLGSPRTSPSCAPWSQLFGITAVWHHINVLIAAVENTWGSTCSVLIAANELLN